MEQSVKFQLNAKQDKRPWKKKERNTECFAYSEKPINNYKSAKNKVYCQEKPGTYFLYSAEAKQALIWIKENFRKSSYWTFRRILRQNLIAEEIDVASSTTLSGVKVKNISMETLGNQILNQKETLEVFCDEPEITEKHLYNLLVSSVEKFKLT